MRCSSSAGGLRFGTGCCRRGAVVYYVLGLALFSTSSYEEVIRMLVSGHSWASGWSHEWSIPTKAALFQARRRLGSEPLRALYDKAAVSVGQSAGGGRFLSVVAADGHRRAVPGSGRHRGNVEWFGRPPVLTGRWAGRSVSASAGCSDWPSADRMRSSMPRSAPTGQGEQTLAESVLRFAETGNATAGRSWIL